MNMESIPVVAACLNERSHCNTIGCGIYCHSTSIHSRNHSAQLTGVKEPSSQPTGMTTEISISFHFSFFSL